MVSVFIIYSSRVSKCSPHQSLTKLGKALDMHDHILHLFKGFFFKATYRVLNYIWTLTLGKQI